MSWNGKNIEIHARKNYNISAGGVDLYIVKRDMNSQKTFVATDFDFSTELEECAPFPPVTTRLDANGTQMLMDSLWNEGIRPSSGEGNVGQIGAIESHLKDMQALVNHHTKGGLTR